MGMRVTPLNPDRARLRDYNLRSYAPEFDQTQPGRIDLCRMLVETMLIKDLPERPLRIVELGCGAGDISGPYSMGRQYFGPRGLIDTAGIEVVGVDLQDDAREKCNRRFPQMRFIQAEVEDLEVIDCDLLIMCEFLEHIETPIPISMKWMAKARWALIGHPLDEPNPPYEAGHAWSYSANDWQMWFTRADYQIWHRVHFPMGPYEMILGHGSKR